MIEKWWAELPNKFPTIQTDEYVVMPNHFHGIVFITTTDDVGANLRVRPNLRGRPNQGAHKGAPLPKIVQWFKTMTTNEYIRGVKQHGWSPFPGKLWQRNYYEHIVQNENELDRIRRYIAENPLKWAIDRENQATRIKER